MATSGETDARLRGTWGMSDDIIGLDPRSRVNEQLGTRLRLRSLPGNACKACMRGGATVGVQGRLVGRHLMLGHGIYEQHLEQGRTFRVLDPPADDAAAINVEDDAEMEIGPFHRPRQFGVRRFKLSPGQLDPGNAGPRLTPGTRCTAAPVCMRESET